MKVIDLPENDDQTKKESVMAERDILIKCIKIPQTTVIVEQFIEEQKLYLIIENAKGKTCTLRDSVVSTGEPNLNEEDTKRCFQTILKVVQNLHKRGIKHGNINLDSVLTRKRSHG